MDIKILGNLLRETIDQGDLRDHHQQAIQKRLMVDLGRHHRAIGERPRGDPWFGQHSLRNHSWKQLSLIGDETVINLQRTKVKVFSDSVLCPRQSSSTSRFQRSLEEQNCRGQRPRKATEILMVSMESRPNSSGTSSQDSQSCTSAVKLMMY